MANSNSNIHTINTNEEFEDTLMWVSDLFKDVHGFRPRGYNFQNWSYLDLAQFVTDLMEINSKQVEEEREYINKAIEDVVSVGAGDKETALRWLDQADAHFMYGDDSFYEDSIEKYGWVASHMEKNINLKSIA
jgi:peptidoglycan/xylan/chitin deacetylase (PgdA/CDA1 family)